MVGFSELALTGLAERPFRGPLANNEMRVVIILIDELL